MCTCYPIINRVSELKVHIELTRFVQPEKIEIDANERAVNEKSQYCFFVCTTFDSFLNDLNDYRDGNGTDPYTTTYWDKDGVKLCINWSGSTGGMDRNTQYIISDLVNKSNGKLALEWGGAWFKYIYFTDDIKEEK